MMQYFEGQYEERAAALNIGLGALEQFRLRRVAYLTNRYVPVYKERERLTTPARRSGSSRRSRTDRSDPLPRALAPRRHRCHREHAATTHGSYGAGDRVDVDRDAG